MGSWVFHPTYTDVLSQHLCSSFLTQTGGGRESLRLEVRLESGLTRTQNNNKHGTFQGITT